MLNGNAERGPTLAAITNAQLKEVARPYQRELLAEDLAEDEPDTTKTVDLATPIGAW